MSSKKGNNARSRSYTPHASLTGEASNPANEPSVEAFHPVLMMNGSSALGDHTVLPETTFSHPLTDNEEDVRPENPATGPVASVSLAGVVDAILEVGHRRKCLLDQLHSALISHNDTEALERAREYCGISEWKN